MVGDSEQDREAVLEQKRTAERARRERLKEEQQRRETERRRVREWAAANPEKVRARQERWRKAHLEHVKQRNREYYYQNREKRLQAGRDYNARRATDPEHVARQREYRAQRRDRLNELQRKKRSTPEGRDRYNREQRDRRRRERRRRELGLPPRPHHRATKNERAQNETAATEFFNRRRSVARRREFKEYVETRANWNRVAHETRQRLDARRQAARNARVRRDLATIDAYLASPRGQTLREQVRMDAHAREARGKPPYPNLNEEARRRVVSALSTIRKPRTRRRSLWKDAPSEPTANPTTGPVTHTDTDRAPSGSTVRF